MPAARTTARDTGSVPWWRTRSAIGIAVATIWFLGVLAVGDVGDLTIPASRMLAIFGAAVALWVSEAIPLSATSIFVILAQILLISDEAMLTLPDSFEPPTYDSIFATLASPILMLFLGGFVLADAAAKYGLDRNLAGVMLRPFGTRPAALLGGLMLITALLSMFVSNTATTAAMMAVVLPVAASLDTDDRFRVALILAVPVAANIGGLGTPVGSPPNAIALGRLDDQGLPVDFIEWMAFAVPIVDGAPRTGLVVARAPLSAVDLGGDDPPRRRIRPQPGCADSVRRIRAHGARVDDRADPRRAIVDRRVRPRGRTPGDQGVHR